MSEDTDLDDPQMVSALLSETEGIQIIPRYDEREQTGTTAILKLPKKELF